MVFKYKALIANVLVRTPVCKPTASPGSQGKMCRVGFVQLLIANILDRTPVCKVRAGFVHLFNANGSDWIRYVKPDFGAKPRENVLSRICTSLQRKRLFWMTRVQPLTNNLVRFTSVILGMLPFVKLERLTFVDLVTFPFVNLVTLRFVKIWS